jgi:hypothetical protein
LNPQRLPPPAGEQLRKGVHLVEADTEVPPAFDSFEEFRDFCIDYRASLGRVARLTACLLPQPALAAASRRLRAALQACSPSSGASLEVRFCCPLSCLPCMHTISM